MTVRSQINMNNQKHYNNDTKIAQGEASYVQIIIKTHKISCAFMLMQLFKVQQKL